jgi:hypothetical protein
MAKDYENFTEEEKREERLDRSRTRESWDRSTTQKRFLFTTAVTISAGIEQLEDSLVAVSELTQEAGKAAEKAAIIAKTRNTIRDMRQIYTRLETAVKYDLEAVERIFERKSSVKGLSEEEEKEMKAYLKDKEAENTPKKRKVGEESYTVPAQNAAGGMGWGGMGQAFPYSIANTAPSPIMMGPWPGFSNMAAPVMGFGPSQATASGMEWGMGQQQTPGRSAGGGGGNGNINGGGKKRFPCDNCGSLEH